jgi:ribosomal protein S18 acetylase RimI-like enzyme
MPAFCPTVWAAMIRRRARGEAVMVARDRRHGIVGVGSCGRAKGVGLPHEGEVFTLYVLQDFQDHGIGKQLLGALFQRLRGAEMSSAVIWVLADNPARFFYEAMGGKRVAERRERLWGTTLPEAGYGWADLRQALALLESSQDGS